MGAIITALLNAKEAGQVVGLLASKTAGGVTLAGLAGLWPLLPGVLAKDPTAIGNAVVIVAGWIIALYGRIVADRKIGG